jgi:LAO/AO transport system kinase
MMEIGDIFAVNKADLPGADLAARTIEGALAAAYMGEPGVNAVTRRAAAAPTPPHMLTPGMAALQRRHGDMTRDDSVWVPPVLTVAAAENTRIADLAGTIDTFIGWSDRTGRRIERARERAYAQMLRAITTLLLAPYTRAPGEPNWPDVITPWVDRVARGVASPYEAARALLQGGRR